MGFSIIRSLREAVGTHPKEMVRTYERCVSEIRLLSGTCTVCARHGQVKNELSDKQAQQFIVL